MAMVVLLLVAAGCDHARKPPAPARPVPFEPYLEIDSAAPDDVAEIAAETRAAAVRLAFVTGSGCTPVWGDGGPVDLPVLRQRVAEARARGVRITVAFGGDGAAELAATCTDVDRLAAAYDTVLDAYRPDSVDFDIEGGQLSDPAATRRRIAALRLVERRRPTAADPLPLVWTLPVEASTGLGSDAVALLRDSRAAGLPVVGVNVLAMDYGTGVTAMGAAARSEAELAERVVRGIWALAPAAARRRVGVTVMIGRNDTPGEVFTPADAVALARFARGDRLGALSYWSADRDRACPGGAPQVIATCSGVAQHPFEFAATLSGNGS